MKCLSNKDHENVYVQPCYCKQKDVTIILKWVLQCEIEKSSNSIPQFILLLPRNSTGGPWRFGLKWGLVLRCDSVIQTPVTLNPYSKPLPSPVTNCASPFGGSDNRSTRRRWAGNIGTATCPVDIVFVIQRLYIFLGTETELLQRLFLEGRSTATYQKLLLRREKFYRDFSLKEDWIVMTVSGR
jgi:hypothetical protein